MTGVAGTPWYSNFYFEDVDAGTAQDAYDRVVAFWQAMAPALDNQVSASVDPFVPKINPVNGEITGSYSVDDFGPILMTNTNVALPYQTQYMAGLSTNVYLGGRELRGRFFLPGICQDNNANGIPSSELRSLVTSKLEDVADPASPTLLVWSRKNGAVYAVVSVRTSTNFSVLRSRRD